MREQVLVEFLRFFGRKETAFTPGIGPRQRQRPLDGQALNLCQTTNVAGSERGDHGFFGSEMFLHLRRHAFGDTGQLGQNHANHRLSRA